MTLIQKSKRCKVPSLYRSKKYAENLIQFFYPQILKMSLVAHPLLFKKDQNKKNSKNKTKNKTKTNTNKQTKAKKREPYFSFFFFRFAFFRFLFFFFSFSQRLCELTKKNQEFYFCFSVSLSLSSFLLLSPNSVYQRNKRRYFLL